MDDAQKKRRAQLAHVATMLMVAVMEDKTEVITSHTVGTERLECKGTMQITGEDGLMWAELNGDAITLHVADVHGAGLEETFPADALTDEVIEVFANRVQLSFTLRLAVAGGPIRARNNIKISTMNLKGSAPKS